GIWAEDPVDAAGNNPVLVNVFCFTNPDGGGSCDGPFPVSVRFDTPRTDVAFDFAGFINCSATSETITVTDQTGGTHTKTLDLTQGAFHFDVTATDSGGQGFAKIDFPLPTCDVGEPDGGFGLDNLTFDSGGVCHSGACDCQPPPPTTTTLPLPARCAAFLSTCGAYGAGLCVDHCVNGSDLCQDNVCVDTNTITSGPCVDDLDCGAGQVCGAAPGSCGISGGSLCVSLCP